MQEPIVKKEEPRKSKIEEYIKTLTEVCVELDQIKKQSEVKLKNIEK